MVDGLLPPLSRGRLPLAVEIAALPEHIRGYGHVKAEHLAKVRTREQELLAQLRPGQSRPAAA